MDSEPSFDVAATPDDPLQQLKDKAAAIAVEFDAVDRTVEAEVLRALVRAVDDGEELWAAEFHRAKRFRYERNAANKRVMQHERVIAQVRELLMIAVNQGSAEPVSELDVIELARMVSLGC